jgi:hypothetical protein
MKYIIDEKLATSILNYLIKKPYIEVKHMCDGLQTLQPMPEEQPGCNDQSHIETCQNCK